METSNEVSKSFFDKLLLVQRELGAITKTTENTYFRSKYATLNDVLSIVKPKLNDHGIFLSQDCGVDQYGHFVKTIIVDVASKEILQGRRPFLVDGKDDQKLAGSETYARRYAIMELLALETTDDDGETAVGRGSNGHSVAATKSASEQMVVGQKASPIKTTLEKISLISKGLIESKRATLDDLKAMLQVYAVKTKEELTVDQALKLLSQLEERMVRK